ncbi:acyltransferase [Oenococcus sp. UCMA 17063]|nr:acyltransferase [Oenococcus sp. UCMA 17063]
MTQTDTPKQSHRTHLHEIDFMRIFFTFGVLFNHTVNKFTLAMSQSDTYYTVRSLRVMFHYTRMGFIFISGVVLTLTYFNRNDWPAFFKKRFNGSLWPYLTWNALLMLLMIALGDPNYQLSNFGNKYLTLIMHGSSFYMYYMLLVMQLYLLFPIIVWLFKKWPHSHNKILFISFICQLTLVFFVKFVMPHMDISNWPYWFKATSINIFAYQFYMIYGVYTCLHYQEIYSFLQRYIRVIVPLAIVMAIGMIAYYRIWDQQILGIDSDSSLSLHQPYIACYDIVMLSLIFWLGKKYASFRQRGFPKWLENFINRAVKVSFGMYLNQTLGLLVLSWLLSVLSLPDWIMMALIPVGWVIVVAISFIIAWFCYKVPPFGFLVGRPNWHPFQAISTRLSGSSTFER